MEKLKWCPRCKEYVSAIILEPEDINEHNAKIECVCALCSHVFWVERVSKEDYE